MGFVELFFIAVGLSMDAFAVAVGKGLTMPRVKPGHAGVIALYFGGFQGLMPLLGFWMGCRFEAYITNIDHWVAFILLSFIGGNMLREALSREGEAECTPFQLNHKELLFMAVATSIDALAVGIMFAFLSVQVIPAVSLIGIITFILSFLGVYVGNWFGLKYKKTAELAGGLVLIAIGAKILLEHLGILG